MQHFASKDDHQNSIWSCLRGKFPHIPEDRLRLEFTLLWDEGMENRDDIIDTLTELMNISQSNKDIWRARAYRSALYALKQYNYPIFSGRQVAHIKGIGVKIVAKIDEIVETGELHALQAQPIAAKERSKVIREFLNIWGVGTVKANALYDAGYRSIQQIPKSVLTEQQQIGVKYYDQLILKIPREQIDKFDETLHQIWYGRYRFVIAGSYRRGLPQSGDIDVLISDVINVRGIPDYLRVNLSEVVSHLKKLGIVIDVLTLGNQIFMGIAVTSDGIARRLDIHYIPPEQWGSGLLYFTGSNEFNIAMRKTAIEKGYKLSEKGLFYAGTNQRVPDTDSEESIFKALGMRYVPPNKR